MNRRPAVGCSAHKMPRTPVDAQLCDAQLAELRAAEAELGEIRWGRTTRCTERPVPGASVRCAREDLGALEGELRSALGVRWLGALVSACLLASLAPSVALTTSPNTPYLYVRDAPLTRNTTVRLQFRGPLVNPPPVDAYYASNEMALDGQGHLDGTQVPWSSPWTLAAGDDGPRTIYGQMHYADDTWSAILELDLILATDAESAMAMDIDPQSTSTVIRLSGGHRWREVARSPEEPIIASAPSTSEFSVSSSFWNVYVSTASGPFAPGRYDIGPFDEDGNCVGNCGLVTTETGTRCLGVRSGWFFVNAITFDPSDDLRMVDLDFHFICRGWMIEAGTVLYGRERGLVAFDQDVAALGYDGEDIGIAASSKTATFTNIGDVPATLGAATFVGAAAADYGVGVDTCSGATLAVGADCSVEVTFTPSDRGLRSATLEFADATARQRRSVRLTGYGFQPTVTTISIPNMPTSGPATRSLIVTTSPAPPQRHQVFLDGRQLFGPTEVRYTNPSRVEFTFSVTLYPGAHEVTARFDGQDFYSASEADPLRFTLDGDQTAPSGTISINGGDEYTNTADVVLDVPGTDGASAITKVALSSDHSLSWWDIRDYFSATQAWNVGPPGDGDDGIKTVYAKWMDAAGNWSDVVSDTIIYDTHAPNVTAPAQQLVVGSTIVGGKVTVEVPWSGDDELSGVAGFDLNQRTDSGAWMDVPVGVAGASLTPESLNRALAPGHAYTFRVRADDNATNTSAWVMGPRLNLTAYQDGNSAITYGGRWLRKSAAAFWGRAATASVKSGATASLTFTGRSFGWVTTYGPDRGKAEVYVNGVLVATVDLYSPTVMNKRVAWAETWTLSSARTVTIKVLATPNRPRVDIDALITAQ